MTSIFGHRREVAHAAQQAPGDARRAARAPCDLARAIFRNADLHHAGTALHDVEQFHFRIEVETHRNAEAVAERRRQKPGARRCADQRELGEVDLHRSRRRPLADDEVELEILHRRIEHFFHGRIEPVDFIDEQHVALFEVGKQRCKVARLGDDRARRRLEVHAQLARHDLRQRRLAKARRPREQHMVQRLATGLRGLDEDLEILLGLRLADEFVKFLRPQMRVDGIFGHQFAAGDLGGHADAFRQ